MLKQLARTLTPPVIWSIWQRFSGNRNVCFKGSYSSWEAAQDDAGGYDSPAIFERVRAAALRVKRGEAVFERDSVCFYHEEYRWPALACLLRVAAENGGVLRVLDFGGSLGSFYFQHRKLFSALKEVRWSVVEQKHYVECGRKDFQSNALRFYETIGDCLANGAVDVVFLSSVLQYLKQPYEVLEQLGKIAVNFILIDRTPFIQAKQDRLTIQHVPGSIYKASYPAWFFSRERFMEAVNDLGFKVELEFQGEDDVGLGEFKGVLLARS